jgi:hypothetical protein
MSSTTERYARATSSSHLRLDMVRACDLDAIIAAGWVRAGLSTSVLRLIVELDGADKRILSNPSDSRMEWSLLSTKLQSLPTARREMLAYAHTVAPRFPEVKVELVLTIALAVLAQHLLPTCPACSGRRFETIPNTPKLSHKACRLCHGRGERQLRVPGGRGGQLLAEALLAGVQAKQAALHELLRRYQRNRVDGGVGTKSGTKRITERCAELLQADPNDEIARRVLARAQEGDPAPKVPQAHPTSSNTISKKGAP